MLNYNQRNCTRETDNLTPPLPPASSNSHNQDSDTDMTETPSLKIIQLNCFNKHDTIQEVLNQEDVGILLLQEPWVNPFTFRIMSHQMWHDVTPYDHVPQDMQTKFRTCIYVAKRHPLKNISILPSKSAYLTALEI